uniref:Hexosyltransferase n=1 Tax=Brassica campestris TaxID=3711 RepID=M4CA11_BRACM
MAVAFRGGRNGVGSGLRSFFSYRIFISALFSFLFLATFSVVLNSSRHQPHLDHTLPRTFQSDPLKTRLDLIHKQATDHLTLVNAYAAYARKLKLDASKQLKLFEDLAVNFSDLQAKPGLKLENGNAIEEDAFRQIEKEVKDKVKTARMMIVESKESYDTQLKIQKLKDTIFAVQEQISNPEKYKDAPFDSAVEDPSLYHYAVFSDNVIAVSVVVRSVVVNAEEPWKHVFHVVTDRMNLAAMKVWFKMRPLDRGARVEIKSVEEFKFLNSSYAPVLRQLESAKLQKFYFENQAENATNIKFKNPKYLSVLNHLRFYLPEMYPKLNKILFLDDDVVVQKDVTGLWKINLDGKVNGAVETCFGSFHRYGQYLNFTHPLIKESFNPNACAWAFGMNIFDLNAWRREKCTDQYHYWQNLNEDRSLWKLGTLPPGLMTFYSKTKSLDKSWHVLGLGYNPGVSMDEIKKAAVIHYNGNMKPWLDIAMNQYKSLWTKYVDNEMEFVQMCNFGL